VNEKQVKNNRRLRRETIANIVDCISRVDFSSNNTLYVKDECITLAELADDWNKHQQRAGKG